MRGEKILITGPAGQVAFPIARELAKTNDVWGITRFGKPEDRERVEALGVTCVTLDMGRDSFDVLPETTVKWKDGFRGEAPGASGKTIKLREARSAFSPRRAGIR